MQRFEVVIVVDHVQQACETPVVIETAFGVSPQAFQRRSAIAIIGRSGGLKIINSDLAGGVHVPARFGEKRWNVASGTLSVAVED